MSKPFAALKSNGQSFSEALVSPFIRSRSVTSSYQLSLSSTDKTDVTRRAKKMVEPPDPYSKTLMRLSRKVSRKSIAAYENHGISRSRGVLAFSTLCERQREMYCGCKTRLEMTRP